MGSVEQMDYVTNANLKDVRVFRLGKAPLERGTPQEVLVEVAPNAEIPMHQHAVDAEMFIVAGSGTVLSIDSALNGVAVQRGAVVLFERRVAHGFKAGKDGLVFLSRNGGIVDSASAEWDLRLDKH